MTHRSNMSDKFTGLVVLVILALGGVGIMALFSGDDEPQETAGARQSGLDVSQIKIESPSLPDLSPITPEGDSSGANVDNPNQTSFKPIDNNITDTPKPTPQNPDVPRLPRVELPRTDLLASITFKNQSGQTALVRVKGPTPHEITIPDGTDRKVHVAGGSYYFTARYGTPKKSKKPSDYTDGRGEKFTIQDRRVREGNAVRREFSSTQVTLHKVINGNFKIAPISANEF